MIENKSAYDYATVEYPGHENKTETASVNATMQKEEEAMDKDCKPGARWDAAEEHRRSWVRRSAEG